MAQNGTLTRKQSKALSALLSCQTVAEAADISGCSRRTIYRWLDDEHFQQALKTAIGDTVTQTVRRLVAGRADALDTLHALLVGAESENVRRLAARDWIDILHRVLEMDVLIDRIEALEEVVLYGKRQFR